MKRSDFSWSGLTLPLAVMTLVVLPWYVVRGSAAGVPYTLLEMAVLLTIACWLVGLMIERRRPHLPDCRWLVWGGVFVVAATMSMVWSPDHRAALGIWKAYIIEPALFFIILVDMITVRPDRRWWVLGGLAIASLEVGSLAVSQWLFHWPIFAPAEAVQGRSTATFNSGNALALFMGPLIALGIPLIRRWVLQARYSLAWAASLIVLLWLGAVGLSHSRGGAIGVIVVIGLAVLMAIRRRMNLLLPPLRRSVLIGLGISLYVLVIGGYMWFGNHPPHVLNPYARPGFTTLTVRACTWEGTVHGLSQHFVTGFGLAGFTPIYLHYITCDAEPLTYPHNLVLNFWTETGLLGLVAMAGFIWAWLSESADVESEDTRWLAVGLALAMVYWLVHGLVDVPYFKNDLAVQWWTLAALVATLNATSTATPPPSHKP